MSIQFRHKICWVVPAEMVISHPLATQDDSEREIIDVDFEDLSDPSPDEPQSTTSQLLLPDDTLS